jgi:hypothetical protein
MVRARRVLRFCAPSAVLSAFALSALAQNIGDTGGSAPPDNANAPAPPTVTTQANGNTINVTGTFGAPSQSTTTTYAPMGLPAPGVDLNPGLPSSSRPSLDASRSSDNFDLLPESGSGAPVRGDPNAMGVVGKHPSNVPALHQVQRGDTLWDLCAGYFNNPWLWPRIWSYNPQIQNPHWIYPGDQVRLRVDVAPEQRSSIVLGASGQIGGGFISRRALVPKDTVFLRDVGYIDDPKKDVWGELAGAQEEQMLLTQGNNVYLIMRPGADLRIGQLLTVFRPVRPPTSVPGARKPPGEIIAFKGTVKVDQWDPNTRMARGRLIESLDIVERGDKVGPVGRRFEVVPPRPSDADVEARVLATIYPHEVIGQNQVAFIDHGAKDGLVAGNRLLVVRRGDAWRRSLETTTVMARTQVHLDVPEHVETSVTPLDGKPQDFPEEVIGELRVLRADENTASTLVTSSRYEIEPGDRVVARKGY